MEEVLGILLSTGLTLDSILDMNFDQIELAAKCVYRHKIEMINTVLEPIAGAFGGKKSPKSIKNKVSSTKKTETKDQGLAKEQHKINQLRLLGIGVRDI